MTTPVDEDGDELMFILAYLAGIVVAAQLESLRPVVPSDVNNIARDMARMAVTDLHIYRAGQKGESHGCAS